MRWSEAHAEFAAALIDREGATPAAIAAPETGRFAVYRNNVMVALIEALAARYPTTLRLVGDDFFRAMARAYARQHQPASPVMLHYGADFPAFVAAFPPAADMGWLADAAALENLQTEAFHAAEASAATRAGLAAAGVGVAACRLRLHPSLRLLRAASPVVTIWAAQQQAEEPEPPPHWIGEDALVVRPEAEVETRLLPAGGHAFVAALRDGARALDAAAAAAQESEGFNAAAFLVALVDAGAVIAIQPAEEHEP